MTTSVDGGTLSPDGAGHAVGTLVHARSVVRWMAQGVTPSVENAQKARAGLDFVAREFSEELAGGHADLTHASRVVAFISMGVVPSQESCTSASEQIQVAMDAVRHAEISTASLRDRFERSR